MDGFIVLGCRERADILRQAVTKFGTAGPSIDRERRQAELARLARRDDKVFDALDSQYYACTEVIEVAANRYVIEHADAFK